ncbi:MAG: MerR family transcriptional regulator [Treponema sp.]|jgi:DNA-binding transcriptional MerR regulator|nr:MerR family transcriptional regulator [Treponema sp.]
MPAPYGIGEVEKLLGVKVHVIRYWEKEIPLVQSRKDLNGRRLYSERDLQILLRLKYLLHRRRFTLEGARDQLFRELSGEAQDLRAEIAALRSELLGLYSLVKSGDGETGNGEQGPEIFGRVLSN